MLSDEEIYNVVKKGNLGYKIDEIEPRNTEPAQENLSTIEEKTDQEVYDLKADSIKMVKDTLTLKIGGSVKLNFTSEPSLSNLPTVVWETSDSEVAIVNSEGVVRAIKEGEVEISATSPENNEITTKCSVTVIVEGVGSVKVTPNTKDLKKDETVQLSVTVEPSTANQEVEWSSEDNEIATVSEDGLVTAIKIGKTNIIATATDGSGVSGKCAINVIPTLVEGITLTPDSKEIERDETFTPEVAITPEEADNKEVTWTSDHEEFATVDSVSGLVTGIAAGEAIITATAKDGSGVTGTCTVTVNPKKVKSITLSESKKTVQKTKKFTLTATVEPNDADNTNVTWKSDHPEYATVENGRVTAVSVGTANITAVASDESGVESEPCVVTVTPLLVTGITIKSAKTLNVGETFTPSLTVNPNEADNKSVTWKSDNTGVATVDETSGLVTAVKEGTANITATSKDGSDVTSNNCVVTVNPMKVSKITLSESEKTLDKGGTFTLTATVEPDNADNKEVTWESDSEHATVNAESGEVTAVSTGTANITAAAKDGSGIKSEACVVTVNPTKVSGITLSESTKSVAAGEKFTLTATVTPEGADDKSVTWESDNTEFATVDANSGEVTAVKEGSANITATAKDGSGVKSEPCVVTITPAS